MITAGEVLKLFYERMQSGIFTGNAVTNVQISNIIRPWNETNCNGGTYEPGHLQKFDLKNFKDVPANVLETIAEEGRDRTLVLYRFFYRNTQKRRVYLGWALTELAQNAPGKLLCSVTERGLTLKQRNSFIFARRKVAVMEKPKAAPQPSAPLPPQRLPSFTPCLSW